MGVRELQIEYEGTTYWLTRAETIIGRTRRCGIMVRAPLISRRHACVARRRDGLYLIDLASKNGTSVNGQPLDGEYRLSAGDRIQIGSAELFVVEAEQPDDEPISRTGDVYGEEDDITTAVKEID